MKHVSLAHMFVLLASFFLFGVTAHGVEAATIRTDATALNSSHTKGLFVIVFTLRAFGNDMYLPTSAVRTGGSGADSAGAVFTVTGSDDTTTATGTAVSMILGTTTIENGMYKIPEGSRATFALTTFLTTPGMNDSRYRVSLTELNYYTDAKGTKRVPYAFGGQLLQTKTLKLTQ